MFFKQITIAVLLAFVSISVSSKPQFATPFAELKAVAEKEGKVSVIVVLGTGKAVEDMMASLNTEDTQVHASYIDQQEAFMNKLGNAGVESFSFFSATPSIALKLDAEAFKRLLKMNKEFVEILPAPDTNSILFDN